MLGDVLRLVNLEATYTRFKRPISRVSENRATGPAPGIALHGGALLPPPLKSALEKIRPKHRNRKKNVPGEIARGNALIDDLAVEPSLL